MFFRPAPADPETGSQQLLTSLLGEEWPGLVEVRYVRRPCAGERARTPPPVYLTSPEDLRERWADLARPNNVGFDVSFAHRDPGKLA